VLVVSALTLCWLILLLPGDPGRNALGQNASDRLGAAALIVWLCHGFG
jgi:hypothetical protein